MSTNADWSMYRATAPQSPHECTAERNDMEQLRGKIQEILPLFIANYANLWKKRLVCDIMGQNCSEVGVRTGWNWLTYFLPCLYTRRHRVSVFVSVFVCSMDVDSPLHRVHLARSCAVRDKHSWRTRRHARLRCLDVTPAVGHERRLPKLASSHRARRAERAQLVSGGKATQDTGGC